MKFLLILLTLYLSIVFSQCDQIRSRPNIYNMTTQDRNTFINAMKRLNSGTRPTTWDRIIYKHMRYYNSIHRNPRFFAWHRMFVYEMESELRKIDSSIRIPYWDWTVHYNNMALDPIWTWFGKNGRISSNWDPDNRCVRDGEFVGFRSFYQSDPNQRGSPHCFKRTENIRNTFTGQRDDIDRNVIDASNQQEFTDNMEYGSHANVHNGIGRDFSSQESPNDPLFWVHHSFVDKLWFDRQMRHPETALTYPSSDNTDLPGYNVRVADTYDPAALCYTYKEDGFKWNIEQPMARAKSMESPKPEPFFPLIGMNGGSMSDQAINQHGRSYVLKDIILPSNFTSFPLPGCKLYHLPEPVGIEFIRMMHYDEVKMRMIERKSALFISQLNRQCLARLR